MLVESVERVSGGVEAATVALQVVEEEEGRLGLVPRRDLQLRRTPRELVQPEGLEGVRHVEGSRGDPLAGGRQREPLLPHVDRARAVSRFEEVAREARPPHEFVGLRRDPLPEGRDHLVLAACLPIHLEETSALVLREDLRALRLDHLDGVAGGPGLPQELDPRAPRLGGEALALGGEALEQRGEAAVSAVGLGQQRQSVAPLARHGREMHGAPRRALGPRPVLGAQGPLGHSELTAGRGLDPALALRDLRLGREEIGDDVEIRGVPRAAEQGEHDRAAIAQLDRSALLPREVGEGVLLLLASGLHGHQRHAQPQLGLDLLVEAAGLDERAVGLEGLVRAAVRVEQARVGQARVEVAGVLRELGEGVGGRREIAEAPGEQASEPARGAADGRIRRARGDAREVAVREPEIAVGRDDRVEDRGRRGPHLGRAGPALHQRVDERRGSRIEPLRRLRVRFGRRLLNGRGQRTEGDGNGEEQLEEKHGRTRRRLASGPPC